MAYRVAAIDVHKMVLIVAVATAADDVPDAAGEALEFECRRFGAMAEERKHLIAWLEQRGVQPGAQALAQGETDPVQLSELGGDRLRCDRKTLIDALRGSPTPIQLQILKLHLNMLGQIDSVIESLASASTPISAIRRCAESHFLRPKNSLRGSEDVPDPASRPNKITTRVLPGGIVMCASS